MAGLTERAGGQESHGEELIAKAQEAWQESMIRRLDELREELRTCDLHNVAARSDGLVEGEAILLTYWGKSVALSWPALEAFSPPEGQPCSTFDTAMLLYYLNTADGSPLADRWIGFRELPDGGFYHQAFQGYSGNQIARVFGDEPETYALAAKAIGGQSLPALAPHAYLFHPLPKIRLAATLWPGDDEFPAKASVLFDAACGHYMPIDGLALLGAGLARRLIKASASPP
ncbi:MAG: DUF3786 domain-containing protein [Anaerolineales bacterium]|nr:DUF3786 domain-containing protein [Anaerolineales bacterium]